MIEMTEERRNELEHENRLLREQIREVQNRFEDKIAELSMVREIGMALLHVRSFERACQLILDVIINNTIARNCSLMLMDDDKNQLFLVAAAEPGKNTYVVEARKVFSKEGVCYNFRPEKGAAGRALLEKRPVLIQDTKNSSLFASQSKSRAKIGSLLSVPLMVENKTIGILNLSHADANIFEANDVNFFNIIANFVALSVHSTLNYENLQYSEAKYRTLSENSNDGIAIIVDKLHVYANPKYQEITGYSIDDLERIPFETLLDTSETGTNIHLIRSLLKNESMNRPFEVQLRGRSGKKIDIEINASPIIYSGKTALIISVRDLTDRKILERQLQRAQKMEAIGTLAGGVAHDLNNILAGLVSYPELLLLDLAKDSPLRKPILTIKESGQKAATIVQDLLTLVRRGVAAMEVVNLTGVISEYLISPEYEKLKDFHPSVKLEADLEADLLNILGSPVHLSKAVMNLVSNAAEAMPEGGEISISTENRYIDRAIRGYDHIEGGDYVVLTVSDTGVGISTEEMERIFEPFYTKKVMGRSGTGLGMAVVWGTVKDHRGYIDVQSTQGRGTTFTLYFPVTRKEVAKEKPSRSIEGYMAKGESILVVDDVKEQKEIASRILKRLGYSVTSVLSGEEAVDYLKDNSADLLVLDMIMEPGIDGLETYKRILKCHPKQKAIIVSGFSETDRVKKARRLGAGAYIRKPFLLENIGKAVRDELDR
ncbi:MAG: response regulator [Deltaproteobacteria bacterium]|nr:MAG: response regulator [Deltaproteobacteria bacterium]